MHSPFRSHHAGSSLLPRHRHDVGYVAIVLSGGFVEVGLHGRVRTGPGDVITHPNFSGHSDFFGKYGAEVFNMPLPYLGRHRIGRIGDPDRIVSLAERDPREAMHTFASQFQELNHDPEDWTDCLAEALRQDPGLSIIGWADAHCLDPASVSRGFRQAFGISPKRFRLEVKVANAIAGIGAAQGAAASLALECGFSDQAHMCRSLRSITGRSAEQIRQSPFKSCPS